MTTIRDQIISAIISKAADMLTTKGYNLNLGNNVQRVRKNLDPAELPAVVVWPKPEEAVSQYGVVQMTMPVKLEGFAVFGATNASTVSEQILGDLIECALGIEWSLAFTSGGTTEIEVGDTITGATSGSTAYVTAVSVATGTWAGGDAAGTLTLRRKDGDFQAENLNVGAATNLATIAGDASGSSAITTTTNDLADDLNYAGGGTDDYPDSGDTIVGAGITVNVKYSTLIGNPYSQ